MAKQKPRAHIRESAAILKEVFQRELAPMADAMIGQIMARAKRKKDLTAIKEITWPGEAGYKRKVLEALAMVAADAIKQARSEVPKAKKVKLAEAIEAIKLDGQTTIFEQLPKELRDKLNKQAQLLVGTQLSDLEKTIFYQYADSYDTTGDLDLLKDDLAGAGMEYLDGQAVNAGSNLLAAKVVNEARSAFFFDSEVLEEIDAFEFTNGDPVTEICQDLAGTVFAKDDPEMFRYTPPLHWNCKSYIEPILSGDLNGREVSKLRPSSPELEDQIQFCEFHQCSHWQQIGRTSRSGNMPTATKRKNKKTVKKFSRFRTPTLDVTFSDDGDVSTRVELIRCGTFHHMFYGKMEITADVLKSFVTNFNDRTKGVDLAIDYSHNSESIAAGWITALTYDDSTKSLWADVKWTPQGQKVLGDKEFRYLSADFSMDYEDAETRATHGPTLHGAGLTNRPFVKGMEPVTQLSEGAGEACGNGVMEMSMEEMAKAIQSLQAAVEKISAGGAATPAAPPAPAAAPVDNCEEPPQDDEEDQNDNGDDESAEGEDGGDAGDNATPPAKKNLKQPPAKAGVKDKKGKDAMTDAEKKEFDELKATNAKLLADAQARTDADRKAADEAKLSERKTAFEKMLSDGKAVEAQRDAYMKSDMDGFFKLAAPAKTVRLSDAGGEGEEGGGAGESDASDEIITLSEKLVTDKKAKNLGEAQSMVLNDPKNAALRKRYEAASYNSGQAINNR